VQAMTATFSEPRSLGWLNLSAGYSDQRRATSEAVCAGNLESHRPALMSYAKRALRNAADAEDAVQETLMAAMQGPESFAGRSSLTSWLYGILKHKIIDIFRRKSRETTFDAAPENEWLADGDALFAPDGSWRESPADWGDPEAALARRDFFQVLESCIACLPERTARIFTLREIMELEVAEICDMLGITPNHCFVTLHRARMKLRALLEERWFALQTAARNEPCQVSGHCGGARVSAAMP
jgi:RNA polymerase sigma-70 factor (TIGR02943 family)